MNFIMKKFNSKLEIYLGIMGLWGICNFLSVVGFYFEYKRIIQIKEAILYNNLTIIFSIPKSFFDTLFLTQAHDLSTVLPEMLIFWPIIIYLMRKLFKNKSISIFAIVSGIFLIGSFRWLVVATGMMGI
jgi:hypothetical protein